MSEFSQHVGLPEEQIELFFRHLAATGDVSASAEKAAISRAYVYKLRKNEPEFAARWAEAKGDIPERIHDAVIDEAVTGTPVLDDAGRVVGHRRNTRLLERLAEKHGILDPQRPTTAVQVNTNVTPGQLPTSSIEEEAKRLRDKLLDDLAARRAAQLPVLDVVATPVDPDEDLL